MRSHEFAFCELTHAVITRYFPKAVELLGRGDCSAHADIAPAIPGRTFRNRIEQPGAIDGY